MNEKTKEESLFLSFLVLFLLVLPTRTFSHSQLLWKTRRRRRNADKWLSSSLETNDPLVSFSLGTESGEELWWWRIAADRWKLDAPHHHHSSPTSPAHPWNACHLSYYLVMSSAVITMVTHCYFMYSNLSNLLQAEGASGGCPVSLYPSVGLNSSLRLDPPQTEPHIFIFIVSWSYRRMG